jgi:hypothetical protein
MHEMRIARISHKTGKAERDMPIGAYAYLDDWERYLPTKLDRIMSALDRG